MTGRGAAVLLALAVLGCRTTPRYVSRPGPYDRVPIEWEADLVQARKAFSERRYAECRSLLEPHARARPELLPVRVFLQDLQVALLESGLEVEGVSVAPGEDPWPALAAYYRDRAEAEPRTEAYVLAARLEEDGDTALELLVQAEELDDDCVWVHYGRAWWNVELRRFPEARKSVRRALRLDGGHLPTVRLHASMLASAGETKQAIEALSVWLEGSAVVPLIGPSERAEAKVDLAALYVLQGDPAAALDLLDGLNLELLRSRTRAELVRAAAYEDLGLRQLALSAARRARAMDPEALLPLVHQALLLQLEGNTMQERTMWQELLEVARERWARSQTGPVDPEAAADIDFQSLLIQLQANARVERIDADRARRDPRRAGQDPSGPPR